MLKRTLDKSKCPYNVNFKSCLLKAFMRWANGPCRKRKTKTAYLLGEASYPTTYRHEEYVR